MMSWKTFYLVCPYFRRQVVSFGANGSFSAGQGFITWAWIYPACVSASKIPRFVLDEDARIDTPQAGW